MSFYFLSGVLLISALLVVTLRNLFHCALFLILALLALAGLYFSLDAPFLGVMQIVIYVGAIMILVIFAIMLTSRISDQLLRSSNRQVVPAVATILAFLALTLAAIARTTFPRSPGKAFDPIIDLGRQLMTTFIFPFEVISLILLVALVGAIVLARKD
jgi:NADH-quinone oxidoreductase subunit J